MRDAALQLRKIDESWDAEVVTPPLELAPTPPVHMAEIVTLRPVSAQDSNPPLLPESTTEGPSALLSHRWIRLVALSKSRRSKNTLLLGAALVLLSAAYAIGGHRTSDSTTASAAPPAAAESAESTARECAPVNVSARPHASIESVSTLPPPKEARHLPPAPAPKRMSPATKPAPHEHPPDLDPDVGF